MSGMKEQRRKEEKVERARFDRRSSVAMRKGGIVRQHFCPRGLFRSRVHSDWQLRPWTTTSNHYNAKHNKSAMHESKNTTDNANL